VKKVRENVRPWRLSACLTAHSVLELPIGAIQHSKTQVGDSVEICPLVPQEARYDQSVSARSDAHLASATDPIVRTCTEAEKKG
jgi:hypothetical protein